MKHEAHLAFDLTNEKEAAIYHMIRNLDGYNKAILEFKNNLREASDEFKYRDSDDDNNKEIEIHNRIKGEIEEIQVLLEKTFKKYGVTI